MFTATIYRSYITALKLEVILDFISAVIIRHFAFLDVRSQIGRQTLPLDGERTDKELRGGTANIHSNHAHVLKSSLVSIIY